MDGNEHREAQIEMQDFTGMAAHRTSAIAGNCFLAIIR
jgi:hypothetical protein